MWGKCCAFTSRNAQQARPSSKYATTRFLEIRYRRCVRFSCPCGARCCLHFGSGCPSRFVYLGCGSRSRTGHRDGGGTGRQPESADGRGTRIDGSARGAGCHLSGSEWLRPRRGTCVSRFRVDGRRGEFGPSQSCPFIHKDQRCAREGRWSRPSRDDYSFRRRSRAARSFRRSAFS